MLEDNPVLNTSDPMSDLPSCMKDLLHQLNTQWTFNGITMNNSVVQVSYVILRLSSPTTHGKWL